MDRTVTEVVEQCSNLCVLGGDVSTNPVEGAVEARECRGKLSEEFVGPW